MSRYHILYNPFAGDGGAAEKAKCLGTCYKDASIYDMTAMGSYEDFFRQIGDEDSVIICGGDGTLNRFANETAEIDRKNNIYYCPVGSGNDFFRDITPTEEEKKEGIYEINRYLRHLPSVTVNGETRHFINGIGYGIDGYCCEEGDRLKAASKKKINYAGIAIKGMFFGFKRANATVTVDGKTRHFKKVWLAPTMNGKYYGGGMIPTPNQDRLAEDGKLSLLVFYKSGKLRTLMVFPTLFKGEHVKRKDVAEVLEGYDITVEFDRPTPLQIDGETISGVSSYHALSYSKKLNEKTSLHLR